MARPSRSRGFTLVELLVVITIIGMLVSLLLPAIQAAREAGRRTTCLNNMRQAAVGLSTLEQTRKGFPGYVSLIPKSSVVPAVLPTGFVRASWVVEILPSLDANALYQNWKNPDLAVVWDSTNPAYNRLQYVTQLSILQCPSNANPDLLDDALSWVVNTGVALTASDNSGSQLSWPEDSASGVMFNHALADNAFNSPTKQTAKRVNMDYLTSNDGTTTTLLLSENLQAGRWATDPVNGDRPFVSDFAARQSAGMVWFLTGNGDNSATSPSTPPPLAGAGGITNYNSNAMGINDLGQYVSGLPKGPYDSTNTTEPTGLAYARPSSYHPGGVNSMCAGQNARFLDESIDYRVYTQLMTSFQNRVVVDYVGNIQGTPLRATYKGPSGNGTIPGTAPGPVSSGGMNNVQVPWGYILNEADL